MLTKKDEAKIASLKKRMKCSSEGCGRHFVFSVSEDYLTNIDNKKQRYVGTCSKCHVAIKLSPAELWVFEEHIGKPTYNIIKTTFNDLFESDNG
jgi:hypothetical protein